MRPRVLNFMRNAMSRRSSMVQRMIPMRFWKRSLAISAGAALMLSGWYSTARISVLNSKSLLILSLYPTVS